MGSEISEFSTSTIDPYRLADQGVQLQGTLPVASLRRAADLLVSDEGSISADLHFGKDEENRRVIRGELEARIWVTCQRCLEPMEEHIQSRFELAIVGDDEGARQIPAHYEPLETHARGGIKVRELIEDELLLAMAPFPAHREEDCNVDLAALERAESQADPVASEGRKKPFELLEGLLDRKNDKSSGH